MDRKRRAVLYGAAVGTLGVLSGCIGGTNSPNSDSTTTAADSTPSSGSDTMTAGSTEITDRTDRPTSPTITEMLPADSTATETVPIGPTNVDITTRTGQLTITEINANPPGSDRQKLFREIITFENTGSQKLDISGYTVSYGETGKTYTYSESYTTTVPPNMTFKLVTGNSDETIMLAEYDSFAGFDEPALSNDGGTITVTDASGNTVLEATYVTE